MKRKVGLTIIAVIVLSLIIPIGFGDAPSANAATKTGRLVKKVEKQRRVSGQWVTTAEYIYKYNRKADPAEIEEKHYDEDGSFVWECEYINSFVYKKGKRIKRTITCSHPDAAVLKAKCTYDKYGHPKKYVIRFADWFREGGSIEYTYSFTKKNDLKKKMTVEKNADGTIEYTFMEGPNIFYTKYSLKKKNGLPSKLTYRNKRKGKKTWGTTYEIRYNKKGLKNREPGTSAMKFTYKYKNGRVSTVTVTTATSSGHRVIKDRYKFTYTKRKASKVRYAKMINSIVWQDYVDMMRYCPEYAWF